MINENQPRHYAVKGLVIRLRLRQVGDEIDHLLLRIYLFQQGGERHLLHRGGISQHQCSGNAGSADMLRQFNEHTFKAAS